MQSPLEFVTELSTETAYSISGESAVWVIVATAYKSSSRTVSIQLEHNGGYSVWVLYGSSTTNRMGSACIIVNGDDGYYAHSLCYYRANDNIDLINLGDITSIKLTGTGLSYCKEYSINLYKLK